MPINRDYVDPDELTTQVRTALADLEINGPNSLAEYLPSETLDDIEYEADAGQGGLIEAAMYRAFDAELPIARDEVLGRMRGRIHPLGQKVPLFEEDRLRLRNGAEDGLSSYITRTSRRIAKSVALAVNWKRAQALATGKLQFVGNDQNFTVDFQRRADFTTTATDLWTDPDADPITYLEDLVDLFEEENGERPAAMLATAATKNTFYRHPKVNMAAWGSNYNPDATRRASEESVTSLLGEYELPAFRTIGGKMKLRNLDGSNSVVSLIPNDSIILVGNGGDAGVAESSDLGRTFWGVTLEAMKPNWGISEWPGIVAAVFDNDDVPARMWIAATAIAMPVMTNPNLTLTAKVR